MWHALTKTVLTTATMIGMLSVPTVSVAAGAKTPKTLLAQLSVAYSNGDAEALSALFPPSDNAQISKGYKLMGQLAAEGGAAGRIIESASEKFGELAVAESLGPHAFMLMMFTAPFHGLDDVGTATIDEQGDSATATIKVVQESEGGSSTTTTKIHMKKIGGSWYMHLPGAEGEPTEQELAQMSTAVEALGQFNASAKKVVAESKTKQAFAAGIKPALEKLAAAMQSLGG